MPEDVDESVGTELDLNVAEVEITAESFQRVADLDSSSFVYVMFKGFVIDICYLFVYWLALDEQGMDFWREILHNNCFRCNYEYRLVVRRPD